MTRCFAILVVSLIVLLAALPVFAQRVDQLPALHAVRRNPTMAPARQPASSAPVTPMPAPAPQPVPLHDRIVAVVNDDVISTSDINDRLHLALISSGLPDNPEVERKLVPQILRGLIDEKLQLQEAKRLDVTVPKADVDNALERISKDNGIPGDIRSFVRQRGGSPTALEQQIRAGIAWNKVITRELRPHVEIGDDEIEAALSRIRANAGKQEYLVSEIFLAVDNPKDEEQVRQVAENLVKQIKGGANFGAVAHQFSQGTGAATGGDIGWIQEGQLAPELNKALVAMPANSISDPVRTASGFDILGLREKRTISLDNLTPDRPVKPAASPVVASAAKQTVSLQQAFLPSSAAATHDAQVAEATKLRGAISSCVNLESQISQKFANWHWQDMGDIAVDKIPGWLADKVKNVAVGQSSEPIATDKGALVVFVCGRHMPEAAKTAEAKPVEAPSAMNSQREQIMNSIGTEKLELQARRLLRDLRRSAYLDIRLNLASSPPPPSGG